MNIFVTGSAGFVGFYVSSVFSQMPNCTVIGFDNINDYYEPSLKYARLGELGINTLPADGHAAKSSKYPSFTFYKGDLTDSAMLSSIFETHGITHIIHLAAQAGVRYSIENPRAYIDSNVIGFLNILECARSFKIKHLVYASSSSVYGLNKKVPFSTHDPVDHPVSLYAATKRSNELMAHTYSHLFGIPTSGLRFFTVYGPWGRPDMAYFSFTKAILEGKTIKIFNHGALSRDFTYIDDIVEGIVNVFHAPPTENSSWDALEGLPDSGKAPFRVYNIGNNKPVALMEFITTLEEVLGKEAIKEMVEMQPGDVETTYADVTDLIQQFNYKPDTQLKDGLRKFIEWYIPYLNNQNEY